MRWAPTNQRVRSRMFQHSRYWTDQMDHKRLGPHKVRIDRGPLSFDLIWFPSCITNGIQSARAEQSHAKGRTAKVTCSPIHCALLSAFLDAGEDAPPGTRQKSRHVHEVITSSSTPCERSIHGFWTSQALRNPVQMLWVRSHSLFPWVEIVCRIPLRPI